MAHVIARQPRGRRGVPEGGSNSSENLILLCPNHHREIYDRPIHLTLLTYGEETSLNFIAQVQAIPIGAPGGPSTKTPHRWR
jgi:hypothetical protein